MMNTRDAAARERDQQPEDADDEAIEARDWHEEWANSHHMTEQADFQTEITK